MEHLDFPGAGGGGSGYLQVVEARAQGGDIEGGGMTVRAAV